jgi:hypothetical protein
MMDTLRHRRAKSGQIQTATSPVRCLQQVPADLLQLSNDFNLLDALPSVLSVGIPSNINDMESNSIRYRNPEDPTKCQWTTVQTD